MFFWWSPNKWLAVTYYEEMGISRSAAPESFVSKGKDRGLNALAQSPKNILQTLWKQRPMLKKQQQQQQKENLPMTVSFWL